MSKRNARKWVMVGCGGCGFFLLVLICLAAVILPMVNKFKQDVQGYDRAHRNEQFLDSGEPLIEKKADTSEEDSDSDGGPGALSPTTTALPAQAADTDAAVAALEKPGARIKNLMTDEQVELGGPIVNSVDMVLVPIPAGEFLMGSPETEERRYDNETQHRVQITKPFYLSAYEVTQAQYEKVMGNNPSDKKGENRPIENVSWDDAMEFCRKLSEKEGVKYRLPTEAEWEYACRAGTTTAYSFGDGVSRLGDYAWHDGNSGDTTHPVGEKLPNNWGLFDMHGNVSEWCYDWYGTYETDQVLVDPKGRASGGSRRVLRGGAFFDQPEIVRAVFRDVSQPGNRLRLFGFRLARTYPLSP